MLRFWRLVFIILLSFFIVHLIRDIMQILGIQNILSESFKSNHTFCQPICDYVTIPPEIFGIVATGIVLKRNRVGQLGIIVIATFSLWNVVWMISYFG